MSNRGKTVISCTLYINNILCVRVDLSNPKHLHHKQQLQITTITNSTMGKKWSIQAVYP